MTEPAVSPGGASTRQPMQNGASRRIRVLLAEDNRINQQFASYVLGKAGYSVEIAANGRLAVNALLAADFDIVLMDVQMPELDGVQATREIRALPEPKRRVPIIAVTAHAMTGAREEYIAAGMNDYLSKPFQPAELLSKIEQFIGEAPSAGWRTQSSEPRKAAETASSDELPVLDMQQLDNFTTVFSTPKMKSLASLYLLDVEARLSLIRQCEIKGDFDGISRQSHMIVSAAGNLGLSKTSTIARRLELACMDRDHATATQLVWDLRASCEASSAALKAWLNGSRAGDNTARNRA